MSGKNTEEPSSVSMSRSLKSDELAATKHNVTAPEDRISLTHKIIYGLGAFVNNLLAAAIGGMTIVFNLGLGMNPALVGLLGSLPRLMDALTDPLMGYISDNTKSRWGRRRPYIFIGAIISGVVFALIWQFPRGMSENYYFWFFLIGSLVFYLGYTIFATPWVALGYELTPDYHERTRLMGVQNAMGQMAYVVSPWFLAIMQASMFTDMVEGAAFLAVAIGGLVIVVGILPAIFLRERFAHPTPNEEQQLIQKSSPVDKGSAWAGILKSIKEFFKGFITTLKVKPFLLLCLATFLVFNGFILIAGLGFYVIAYYIFGGDLELAAKYAGWAGTIGAVSTFIIIALVTWLSTKIGKRKTFFFAMGMSIFGYLLKWICYNPDYPMLLLIPGPFISFGLAGLFTLMGSMMADVCDLDELNTHERREGMFGSIYWWVVKLGMAVALALSGYLLNATGFDVALKGDQTEQTLFLLRIADIGVPVIATVIAIWAIVVFPITEEKANQVRQQLEARRGKASAET